MGVNYHPSDIEPRCDYAFKNTNILLGRAAARAMHDTEETRGRWPFVNVNWRFGFAVGKGFFRVVWLDHALRIDHDTSKGKDWLNVYVYGGPVEKCQAYRTP